MRISLAIIVVGLLLLPATGPARPTDPSRPSDRDVAHWSRVLILKAFVSRDTYLDYRDPTGPPEFGWHVRSATGKHLTGGALYTTLYVPYDLNTKLRMALVERDVFNDDLVAAFDLKSGKHRYDITRAGDFAEIERTSFYPDSKSGSDAKAPGRSLAPGKDRSDSVSFLGGDYTDYHRLPDTAKGQHIFYTGRCRIDFPGGEASVAPTSNSIGSVFLIEVHSGRSLRVRANVGGGVCKYALFLAPAGPGARASIRGRYLRHLDRSTSRSDFDYFVRAMGKYDQAGTLAYCRARPKTETARIACAFYLDKHGTLADMKRLKREYQGESRRYRGLLRHLHGRK